ncbi:efflux RND transporter periplasmic adaptor subunit [Methylocystis sp. JAN1]|uniref:efflux RND transporter periplasmic adaptor subunit n=1 Tax=Methylocystis sp. JAN1 TaxID=3397211 RepID=UPI003FA28F0A
MAAPARMRRYAPLVASATLVAAAAGGALYWRTMQEGARHELATVERGAIIRTADMTGVVVSAPPAAAAAPVPGMIESVACRDGDQVKAGRICARIIPLDRQAEVDRARRALAAAQAAQRRSAAALERATTAKTRAAARLRQAQTVTSRREAALRAAQEKGAPVVAPVDGTVGGSRLEAGVAAKAGEILFRVAPAEGSLHFEAAPEAGAALQAPPGAPATATFANDPSQRVTGKLRETSQAKNALRIVVEVPAPASAARPGATASLRIELDRREDVLRVPYRALHYAPSDGASLAPPPSGWARVWAWRDGNAVPVAVKPGLDDGAYVEIVGGALEAGDRVVVNGKKRTP